MHICKPFKQWTIFSVVLDKDAILTCSFKHVKCCKYNCEHNYECHSLWTVQNQLMVEFCSSYSIGEHISLSKFFSVFSRRSNATFCFPGLGYWEAWAQASPHWRFWADDRLLCSAHCLPDLTGNTRGTVDFYSLIYLF